MKFQSLIVSAFACLAAAAPLASNEASESFEAEPIQDLIARQSGSTSDELKNGACKDVTFIFARGSTELGNMGGVVGPQVCSALKARLGSSRVACQGVGSPYEATLGDNFLPKGTSSAAIGAANALYNLANSKCPNTKIVTGGYSQGSAVVDNSIQAVSSTVRNQIKGVVLFGFTRNLQDLGRIPGYPTSQTKVYCAFGDLVCSGTLIITAAHLTYGADAYSAAAFLASKV